MSLYRKVHRTLDVSFLAPGVGNFKLERKQPRWKAPADLAAAISA
jgi:hypothetical protein